MTRIIAAAALALATGIAQAQPAYPARPVRLVVPSAPGGGTDVTARIVAPRMTELLGQQVVVENRAGAGTMIGGELVARAAPDGYTLLMGISTLAINPAMYRKVAYDALRDFAAVSQVVSLPNILVVHPSLPARNVKEFVALARARPGQLNYGSAGIGTNPHLAMELLLLSTGTKITHVAYKGSGLAIQDAIAGHVPVSMPSILTAVEYARQGRLRALGVSSAKRASGVPDIPTIAEAGVAGYEATQWFGIVAPAATPRDIVVKLHGVIVNTVRHADTRERLVNGGAEPIGSSPEEFSTYIRSETVKWAKVVKSAGISPQ